MDRMPRQYRITPNERREQKSIFECSPGVAIGCTVICRFEIERSCPDESPLVLPMPIQLVL